MQNPWSSLLANSPYELEMDEPAISEFNKYPKRKQEHVLQTHYFPEPFLGDVVHSNIVLLNLNPGVEKSNVEHHKNSTYLSKARANLTHTATNYPFFPLHPDLKGMPCHRWWSTKLGSLIRDSSIEKVSKHITCLELHGYPSVKFHNAVTLPSTKYTGYLLEKAMERKAQIIIMRGRKLWETLVPQLADYNSVATLNSVQNPCISLINVGDATYQKLLSIINGN